MRSFRGEPRATARNRVKVGWRGKGVAKKMAVANDPMGYQDALKGTCHGSPKRAILSW